MDTVATETEDINGMETNHKRESDLLKMLSEKDKNCFYGYGCNGTHKRVKTAEDRLGY